MPELENIRKYMLISIAGLEEDYSEKGMALAKEWLNSMEKDKSASNIYRQSLIDAENIKKFLEKEI